MQRSVKIYKINGTLVSLNNKDTERLVYKFLKVTSYIMEFFKIQ